MACIDRITVQKTKFQNMGTYFYPHVWDWKNYLNGFQRQKAQTTDWKAAFWISTNNTPMVGGEQSAILCYALSKRCG